MKRILQAVFAVLMLTSVGCTTRNITAIDDHSSGTATLVESQDHYNYLVYQKFVKQFWECEDKGKEMTCRPSCGFSREAECPTDSIILIWPMSNYRVVQ
jgi:hypothetical protein